MSTIKSGILYFTHLASFPRGEALTQLVKSFARAPQPFKLKLKGQSRLAHVNDSKASELFTLALDTISQLTDYEKAGSLLRLDERFTQLNRKLTEGERVLLKQVLS